MKKYVLCICDYVSKIKHESTYEQYGLIQVTVLGLK